VERHQVGCLALQFDHLAKAQARQVQNLRDEQIHPVGGTFNTRQMFEQFGFIRRVPSLNARSQQLRRALDDRERRPHVVGNRGEKILPLLFQEMPRRLITEDHYRSGELHR